MHTDTALLVIDLQKEDGFALERFDQVVANAASILQLARRQGLPIIYTRHVNNADGQDLAGGEPLDADGRPASYCAGTAAVEVLDALAPQPGDSVIDKPRYSAFYRSTLDAELERRGIRHLVVFGVLTDVCVLSSVFDAYCRDYRISLIADACTATTLAAHYSALMILSNWVYGLQLFSTEQYLRALRGEAFSALTSREPDHLAHQPADLPQAIARLDASLAAQR